MDEEFVIQNEPPWVVEIEGVKFTTPEPVCLLLQDVSEERDQLEADNERLLGVLTRDGQLASIHFETWAGSIRRDSGYSGGNLEVYLRSIADALREGG